MTKQHVNACLAPKKFICTYVIFFSQVSLVFTPDSKIGKPTIK